MTVIGNVRIFHCNDEECPKLLYHYTTINALYNIFKNKELWLGNTSAMNDKNEITEFYNNLKARLLSDFPDKEETINSLINFSINKIDRNYPFVMSFSTCKDDAAQWDRYADKAQGGCIVFNRPKLVELLSDLPMGLDKVYYGDDVSEICNRDYHILSDYLKSDKTTNLIFENESNNTFNQVKDSLTYLINYAVKYKNMSFASEKEYRIYTSSGRPTNADFNFFMSHSNPTHSPVCFDYQISGNQIKKILKIRLDNQYHKIKLDDIIERIIVGPRSEQSLAILKEYLKTEECPQLAEKIENSKCTLR